MQYRVLTKKNRTLRIIIVAVFILVLFLSAILADKLDSTQFAGNVVLIVLLPLVVFIGICVILLVLNTSELIIDPEKIVIAERPGEKTIYTKDSVASVAAYTQTIRTRRGSSMRFVLGLAFKDRDSQDFYLRKSKLFKILNEFVKNGYLSEETAARSVQQIKNDVKVQNIVMMIAAGFAIFVVAYAIYYSSTLK